MVRPSPTLLACAVLLLGTLAALHVFYPLPYVAKVLLYGNEGYPPDYDVPLANIPASDEPRPLPRALDSRVEQRLVQFEGIEDANAFLEASGTTALVVVARGQLVAEQYLGGHTAQSLRQTYSVTKAVLSALVGVALDDGVLALDAPVSRYVPELAARDDGFNRILVTDLLNMRSGIAYQSGMPFPFVNAHDALLYYDDDVEAIALEHATIAEPPGAFDYHQYNSVLLGLILRRATGMTVAEYLQSHLWTPMGAQWPAQWITDDSGFEMMAFGLKATAVDLAKVGLLYLRDGQVGNRSLVPPAWTRLPGADDTAYATPTDERPYRNGWWLVARDGAPGDFSATGSYGQYLYVSADSDVVIVRMGVSRGGWNDDQWFDLFAFVARGL